MNCQEIYVNIAIFNNSLFDKIYFSIAFVCIESEVLYRKNATHIETNSISNDTWIDPFYMYSL